MKTILCLAPYKFLPAENGGQKAIVTLYKNLSKHFRIICIGTIDNELNGSASFEMRTMLSTSALRYINISLLLSLVKIIKKEKVDYIETEHPYFGWLVFLLKRFAHTPLIIRSHNIEAVRFKKLGKRWWRLLFIYEGWVYRKADFVFFITEEDKNFAINSYHVQPQKAITITYGIDILAPPNTEEKAIARDYLVKKYSLTNDTKLVLFNGAFNYKPNLNALYNLINNIVPLLKQHQSFKFIICGTGIPQESKNKLTDNVIYAGFVDDINIYLKGADIFVNPVCEGGGIKTKLVEALGYNLTCVSFATGAIGVDPALCNDKLLIAADNDWIEFANLLIAASSIKTSIPSKFYDHFFSQKIMEKITSIL